MSWSHHLLVAGAGFIVLGACSAPGPGPSSRTANPVRGSAALSKLGWLAGCWEARTAGSTTIEMWMAPDGGLMLGASRTVTGSATREFEHLRIHQRGDTVTYTAIPSGQRETVFRATQISDSGFTVENPVHDFPQRITYERHGTDSLIARVEGSGDRGARGFTVRMGQVACQGGW